jgi:DNA-binding transcriptional regulator YhcF (GntR family)
MAWSKRFVENEDKKAAREQAYAQEVGERIQRIVDVLLTMGFSRKKASDLVVDAVYEDAAATDDEILNKIMNMEFDQ